MARTSSTESCNLSPNKEVLLTAEIYVGDIVVIMWAVWFASIPNSTPTNPNATILLGNITLLQSNNDTAYKG